MAPNRFASVSVVVAAAALAATSTFPATVQATRPQRRGAKNAAAGALTGPSLPESIFSDVEKELSVIGHTLRDAELQGNAGKDAADNWRQKSYAMLMKDKQHLDDVTSDTIGNMMEAQKETETGVSGPEGRSVHNLLSYALKTDRRADHPELSENTKHEDHLWGEKANMANMDNAISGDQANGGSEEDDNTILSPGTGWHAHHEHEGETTHEDLAETETRAEDQKLESSQDDLIDHHHHHHEEEKHEGDHHHHHHHLHAVRPANSHTQVTSISLHDFEGLCDHRLCIDPNLIWWVFIVPVCQNRLPDSQLDA
mmetsp:Transcript_12782/g.28317  ORF Transcript_12782/g.28317 Transcript_12782/m.28317 type:complete len:312 (+) Transcript_12782:313-1248(+)